MIEFGPDGVTVDAKYVPYGEVPDCVRTHLARVPRTLEIEAMAKELSGHGFQESEVAAFVRAVCTWGGYAGIAGRVLRDNSLHEVATSFRDALRDLESGVDVAVRRVLALRQLGVSFASKHLRFLAPQACSILDSKMAAAAEFASNPRGLAQYSALCMSLSERLQARQIEDPVQRPGGRWYPADVDMALFAITRCWTSGRAG